MGIGSMKGVGATVTRWTRCGMIAIFSGSAPLLRLPRSAASSAAISQAGSCCSSSFTTTSGHRRQQYILHSPAIDALVGDDDQSLMIAAHQPSEADLSPLSPASNRPVANIA